MAETFRDGGGLFGEDVEGESLTSRLRGSLFSEDEGPDAEGEELLGRRGFFGEDDPEGGDPDVQGRTADFDADRFELGRDDDAGVGSFAPSELADDGPEGWLD
jgi:hypothetical protein